MVCMSFSVFVCVYVCVMESMCANPCPCADPAELQPASLVPTDPSCCLSAERKAITLKQHNALAGELQVSLLSVVLIPHIHGCRCHVYSALPVKLHIPLSEIYFEMPINYRVLMAECKHHF